MDEIIQMLQSLIAQVSEAQGEFSDQELESFYNVFQQTFDFIQESRQAPETPYGTELLWNLANGNPDAFVSYLQTVPDPALNQLLRNPTQLRETIDNLMRRFPQAEPERIGAIEQAPINSSNVWGFAYDPQKGSLQVRFQGDGIYQYEGVPAYIFKIFQAGAIPAKTTGQNQYGSWWRGKKPSLGASLFELIKRGGYPYQKVA